jgi:hypothetical protein
MQSGISGESGDRQGSIGSKEDQRHHAPRDYRGNDPAA